MINRARRIENVPVVSLIDRSPSRLGGPPFGSRVTARPNRIWLYSEIVILSYQCFLAVPVDGRWSESNSDFHPYSSSVLCPPLPPAGGVSAFGAGVLLP